MSTLSCPLCQKKTLVAEPYLNAWRNMCYECYQSRLDYKSCALTVIPLKPRERMSNEQKPVEQIKPSLTQSQGKGASGLKDDGGKLMWHLLPWKAVEGMIKVLTFGALKYSPQGWRTVPNAKEMYLSAMMRHIRALSAGEVVDPESGLRHIDHIVTNACFLSELED